MYKRQELFATLRNYENDEVSIVFGNEQSGLSNEEVQLCNHIVCIPTDNAYTSLNLASAVQIFSYEYFNYTHLCICDMLTKEKIEKIHYDELIKVIDKNL